MTSTTAKISRRNIIAAGAGVLAMPYVVRGGFGRAIAKAPFAGKSLPGHYRFKFGGFEITTINDGAVALPGPFGTFGQDRTKKEVNSLATANHLPAGKFEIGFTPVVINTGEQLVLFDTGNGSERAPTTGKLAQGLKAAGFSPDQIDVVVITHYHPDHISGLIESEKPVFANARYVTGELENNFWTNEDRMFGKVSENALLAEDKVVPLAEKTTFIKPGASVVSGITALAATGHTPGHMAYHIETSGQRIVLGGDFCNHYVMSLQRPDWHVRFDMDKQDAARSRRKILEMLAADKLPFTSYHMPFPSVGYVEKAATGFRYVPVSYQFNL